MTAANSSSRKELHRQQQRSLLSSQAALGKEVAGFAGGGGSFLPVGAATMQGMELGTSVPPAKTRHRDDPAVEAAVFARHVSG
jgi:hypothetical protein